MGGISVWQFLIIAIVVVAFFLPVLLTGFSKRAKGAEKAGWLILVIFTSWIGYGLFLIITHLFDNTGRQQP